MYSTARQEMVRVSCDLDANPTDVSFTWKFNSSRYEPIDIPASFFVNDNARSVVQHTPMTAQVSLYY